MRLHHSRVVLMFQTDLSLFSAAVMTNISTEMKLLKQMAPLQPPQAAAPPPASLLLLLLQLHKHQTMLPQLLPQLLHERVETG